MRCEILENMMETKILLSQARVDSLVVNQDNVAASLEQYGDSPHDVWIVFRKEQLHLGSLERLHQVKEIEHNHPKIAHEA
jgi:hypothetical protein